MSAISTSRSQARFFLIETTLGNTILPASSKTLVNIIENTYAHKEVSDLAIGERVLYRKDAINKPLEEIEAVLLESPRYAAADGALHKIQFEKKISRFRHDLILSIAASCNITKDNLEQKIFKVDENDFSDSQYAAMEGQVLSILEPYEFKHPYKNATTIRNWLNGQTKAADDWDVFSKLSEVYPLFEEWVNPNTALEKEHELYTTVRRTIMRYIASKGKEKQAKIGKHPKGNGPGLSIAPEIDLVVSEFFGDVSSEYSLARILSIKPIEPNPSIRSNATPAISLSDGITTPKNAKANIRALSTKELYDAHNVVRDVLLDVIFNYNKALDTKEPTGFLGTLGLWYAGYKPSDYHLSIGGFFGYVLSEQGSLPAQFTASWRQRYLASKRAVSNASPEVPADSLIKIYKDIEGLCDHMLNLEHGSWQKLLSTYRKIAVGVPNQAWTLLAEASRQEGYKKDQIFDKLKRLYDIDPRIDKVSLVSVAHAHPKYRKLRDGLITKRGAMSSLLIDLGIENPDILQRLWTKEEMKASLETFGLSRFMQFVNPYNFLHERDVYQRTLGKK